MISPDCARSCGDEARYQRRQSDPASPALPSHALQFEKLNDNYRGQYCNAFTGLSVATVITELHEIRVVKRPSTDDQGTKLTGRTTILNPNHTIGRILEKNLMLDFRLRAILKVS